MVFQEKFGVDHAAETGTTQTSSITYHEGLVQYEIDTLLFGIIGFEKFCFLSVTWHPQQTN